MKGGPFENETLGPSRQSSKGYSDRFNLNNCTIAAVGHMEMEWVMIIMIHRDYYAIEPANLWHIFFLSSKR